jgi:hypothetical protein
MQTMCVCRSQSSFSSSSVFHFSLLTAIFFATILCTALQGQEAAQPAAVRAPLITQPLDESRLTTLKGNTHPLARPLFDLGTAPASLPMERMLLVLKRSPEQEGTLRKLLDDQQDKGSPNYHKWLTPEQFGKTFGPSDSDMQAIASWLQSHGFQVGTTKGRTVLEFSGSASQVKEAFHTTIHKYAVNGEQHWANASDPQIPTALTPAVAGIKTLHNFLKKPAIHVSEKRLLAKLVPGARPQFTGSDGTHALTPGDYATIYSAGPAGIDGTGITIAVVARSNLFNGGSDISDFRNVFAMPAGTLNTILNGPDPGDLGGNEEFEATLDASWSGAIATGATIDFVVSGSTNDTDGVDLSELYIIENNLGSLMTESFSSCESGLTSTDAAGISGLAEQAAAQGITYLLATGDTGAEGCDNLGETTATGGVFVSALAATPFTVAVGGTMFNENGHDATYWNTANDAALGSAISYIPEDVWNETCTTACQSGQPPLAAGGGGASVLFPKPAWQIGVTGIPADGKRDLPDVSLSAAGHDPYLLCVEGSCIPDTQGNISFSGVEGTSASTPSFASIMALVDEQMSKGVEGASGTRQGQADYVLYQLAANQQKAGTACNASGTSLPNSACVFYDVTVGNNSVPGETGYPTGQYASSTGYDLASGLGSVNITNLVNAWNTVSFPATTTTITINTIAGGNTTPVALTHGTSVATVAGMVTASSGTPTGDVALIAGGQTSSPSNQSGITMFTLSSGNISGSTTQLPGGTYTVTAHYAGDGKFAPSDSAPGVLVAVTAENSTTTLVGPFTTDSNGNYTVPFTSGPFGSPVFLSADVVGASGTGTPTGTVTFSTTSGTIPNTTSPTLNSNGVASLISNPFLLSGPVVPFDEGSYTISATYNHDSSFNSSSSTQPATFTIQSGFVGVSGPTNVTITAPGLSGTTTVGIIASSKFTTAIAFTCSGLPSEAACSPASATGKGPGTVVSTNITVTTTAPHTTMLQSNERRYYYAVILGGGLPLAGLLLLAAPKRRRSSTLLGLMVVALLVMVPACGGGGSSHHQDPGTPTGTYTVTVTATAGSLSTSGNFTLTLQ